MTNTPGAPPKRGAVLWVTSPWEVLDHRRDTTLRLMRECLAMGIEAWWASVHTLRHEEGEVRIDARRIISIGKTQIQERIQRAEPVALTPARFRSIYFRVDPPVDEAYTAALQVLLGGTGARAKIAGIEALLATGSKLAPLSLNLPSPPAIVSARWDDLRDFLRKHGDTYLKPLADMQGRGVLRLRWSTATESSHRRRLAHATGSFRRPVLLQRRIAAPRQETRLWFVGSEYLGAVARSRGGRVERTRLSASQRVTARQIAIALRRARIQLAAVDLVGDLVVDLNFVSPGLLIETEKALRRNVARAILRALLFARAPQSARGVDE